MGWGQEYTFQEKKNGTIATYNLKFNLRKYDELQEEGQITPIPSLFWHNEWICRVWNISREKKKKCLVL